MDYPTQQDLATVGATAVLLTPGTRIDPAQITVQGSDINIIIQESAAIGDEVIRQLSLSDQGRYLDSAVGAQIDRLGVDWYDLPRNPATAPVGVVTLTRPTAGAGAGSFASGAQIRYSPTGQVFTLTQTAVFTGSSLTATLTNAATTYIPVEGSTLGAAADVPASATSAWTWVTAPFDPTVVISNAFPLLGNDAESDSAYKARIRAYFPSIQRGTLQAIENGALTVPQVAQAVAIESSSPVTIPTDIGLTPAQTTAILAALGNIVPAPYVQLFVADQNGNSNPYIIGQVQQAIVSYRSAGVYVEVIGALPVQVYITLTGVSVPVGVDPVATQEDIQAAIVEYVNNLAPGASLTLSGILGAAEGADTQATFNGAASGNLLIGVAPNPSGTLDLTASAGQTFRTSLSSVTVTG